MAQGIGSAMKVAGLGSQGVRLSKLKPHTMCLLHIPASLDGSVDSRRLHLEKGLHRVKTQDSA